MIKVNKNEVELSGNMPLFYAELTCLMVVLIKGEDKGPVVAARMIVHSLVQALNADTSKDTFYKIDGGTMIDFIKQMNEDGQTGG
jgi:hypothetical protein